MVPFLGTLDNFATSALTNRRDQIIVGTVSASEIIKELPKLSDTERRAILDKLRELAGVDDERWERLLNDRSFFPYISY